MKFIDSVRFTASSLKILLITMLRDLKKVNDIL